MLCHIAQALSRLSAEMFTFKQRGIRALLLLLTRLPVQMEENMYRAFQHFDTDNSGTISQAELREALRVSTMPAHSRWAVPAALQAAISIATQSAMLLADYF